MAFYETTRSYRIENRQHECRDLAHTRQSANNKIVLLIVLAFFCCAILLVACVGDPQWSKYIYIWQSHYLKKADGYMIHRHRYLSDTARNTTVGDGLMLSHDPVMTVPENHTGWWRIWRADRLLIYEGEYENGEPIGIHISYGDDGKKRFVEKFLSPTQSFVTEYDRQGRGVEYFELSIQGGHLVKISKSQ